ncbi:MAG TPA: gamma-glutamyl-gamma-aminobutyrate hydrolase family protein [Steroidobacteraceae bacterium]|nr:gamma-glutamyl-gamma-aminobutyrate hydrolase family protein [Steroidobacteraceae bacterium]
MSTQRPLIGIPADRRLLGDQPCHIVTEKYLLAVLAAADCIPVIVPSIGDELAMDELLGSLHGLLFMGSPSNVEPHRYQGSPSVEGTLHDRHRDDTTLPLIPKAVDAGMPVFGICRGFQEMNVAFGGTLCQRLHEQPGLMDHREDTDQPIDVRYGPAHRVNLVPGGYLQQLAGGASEITVNSLHWQGVQTLGRGLAIEATAPDGVIEAFRVTDAASFAVAVQWHPEWRVLENPFSRALFGAFGAACREHKQSARSAR